MLYAMFATGSSLMNFQEKLEKGIPVNKYAGGGNNYSEGFCKQSSTNYTARSFPLAVK